MGEAIDVSDVQRTKVCVEAIVREPIIDGEVEWRVDLRPRSVFGCAVRRLGRSFGG